MLILGIYLGHDLGACLLQDGTVVCAIEEERLTRVKHGLPGDVRGLWLRFSHRFGYLPWASITYCLRSIGASIDDLDAIVLPPMVPADGLKSLLPVRNPSRILVIDTPTGAVHHFCHALSSFLASPFERAAVLILDGDGSINESGAEAETGYLFTSRTGEYKELFKNRYDNKGKWMGGLGWMYEYVSAILGFVETQIGYIAQPGKTMGLAAYGREDPLLQSSWVERSGYSLDFQGFFQWLENSGFASQVQFNTTERSIVREGGAITTFGNNLAYKVQSELERAVLGLCETLAAATGEENLCLAGGVALNSVANGKVTESRLFKDVFIQPAAGDGGLALGLAYLGHLKLSRIPPKPMVHAYTGRSYSDIEIRRLLQDSGIEFTSVADDTALASDAAEQLAAGRVIAWFQGGAELGPRALGHRSLLADPRPSWMKDHLNGRVKLREGFRPFAPVALREHVAEVFEFSGDSPYMLLVAKVREAWRSQIPAVTHADGTARLQTVDPLTNPLLHEVISRFHGATGVPLILNTSFNLPGSPIVESPYDALVCFCCTEIDLLYLGSYKLQRPRPESIVPSVCAGWKLVMAPIAPGASTPQAKVINKTTRRALGRTTEAARVFAGIDGARTVDDLAEASGVALDDVTVVLLEAARAGAVSLKIGTLSIFCPTGK